MTAVLWPVLGHFAWVFLLYAWLSFARYRAVQSGETRWGAFEFGREEPAAIARITRNLGNQFELPVVFYAALLLLMQRGAAGGWDVAMAWLFLAGRIVHTGVQTLTSDVKLRGRVFVINALGVAGLAGHLAWAAL